MDDASTTARLDWSGVDFARDFSAGAHWDATRVERVGATIRACAVEATKTTSGDAADDGGRDADALRRLDANEIVRALVASGAYDADVRAGLRAWIRRRNEGNDGVKIGWHAFAECEDAAAERLRVSAPDGEAASGGEEAVEDDANGASSSWSWTRMAKVGAASAIGGSLLFVTGGVAAPAVMASLNALGAVGATTTGILATLGGCSAVFGATGAGLTGYKMMRRTSKEMERFQYIPLRGAGRKFAMHLFVPGFLREEGDLLRAWGSKDNQYVVVVSEPGTLGVSLERAEDGSTVVTVERGDKSIAAAAGVVSGSVLLSCQSLNPEAMRRSHSYSTLNKAVSSMTLEALEAVARPIELRLQLPSVTADAFDDKIENLVQELDETVSTDRRTPSPAQQQNASTTWVNKTGEQYVLNWEPSTLIQLGTAIKFIAERFAVTIAAPQILAQTALASIASAVAWPVALIRASDFLDSPWTMARNKAEIAGEEIAHALLSRAHGNRPVTLVSYSVGAYVVQSTLAHLHAAGAKGKNIVERVVFVSAPISASASVWECMREVVSGRLINVHCPDDWILMYLYRLKSIDPTSTLAGLSPVKRDDVENFNISFKHANLPDEMARILKIIDLEE